MSRLTLLTYISRHTLQLSPRYTRIRDMTRSAYAQQMHLIVRANAAHYETMLQPPLRAVVVSIALAFAFAGCATQTTESAKPAPSGPATAALPTIKAGMTRDQIVATIGKPLSVRPVPGEENAEIWTYARPAGGTTTLTATGTSSVPVANPITGEIHSVTEPSYSSERIDVEQRTELLIYDGKLVNWKQVYVGERAFR